MVQAVSLASDQIEPHEVVQAGFHVQRVPRRSDPWNQNVEREDGKGLWTLRRAVDRPPGTVPWRPGRSFRRGRATLRSGALHGWVTYRVTRERSTGFQSSSVRGACLGIAIVTFGEPLASCAILPLLQFQPAQHMEVW